MAVSGVLFGRLFRQSVGRNGESFGSRPLSIAGGSFALGRRAEVPFFTEHVPRCHVVETLEVAYFDDD